MLFAARRQGRGQQVDLGDLMVLDDGGQRAGLGSVQRLVVHTDDPPFRRQIAGDNRVAPMARHQGMGEFGADLSVGTHDQDTWFHFRHQASTGRVRGPPG